ncbi:MAG: DUF4105 domain-containing protein [Muribaculaceae bacterium]|nr:DUF4105 domain-containing protein [Muribaculaceae bacterium]
MLDFLKRIIITAIIAVLSLPVKATDVPTGEPVDSALSAAPRVSLLTVSPGAEIYELDGHTAMRFYLPGKYDYVVNWGVFDFNAPNFLYRFVKGETDYMAYPFPFGYFIEEYRTQGREVTEQVFHLTPAQAIALQQMVEENLLPQNRTYRYNYIYDNCATRPFQLVEKAVGSEIILPDTVPFTYGETGIADTPGRHTFRTEMTRTHADYPWYQFGIDVALGNGLDREISTRERLYSPLFLKEALTQAYYLTPDRQQYPIVSTTRVILPAKSRVTATPTPGWLTPDAVACILLILTAVVAWHDIRRRKVTRWYDSVIYSCLFIVSLLLTFLIFVSVHEATSPNWLYLWINPMTIIPAVFIWLKSCKRVVYCYQICNFAALFLLLVISIIGIQRLNSAFYMLIVANMLLSARYIYVRH